MSTKVPKMKDNLNCALSELAVSSLLAHVNEACSNSRVFETGLTLFAFSSTGSYVYEYIKRVQDTQQTAVDVCLNF